MPDAADEQTHRSARARRGSAAGAGDASGRALGVPDGGQSVPLGQLRTASEEGIEHAATAAKVCVRVGIPFHVACAVLDKQANRPAPDGVGVCGLVSPMMLAAARRRGLDVEDPADNMYLAFTQMADYYAKSGSWATAARKYLASEEHGDDLSSRIERWAERLRIRG